MLAGPVHADAAGRRRRALSTLGVVAIAVAGGLVGLGAGLLFARHEAQQLAQEAQARGEYVCGMAGFIGLLQVLVGGLLGGALAVAIALELRGRSRSAACAGDGGSET